MTKHITLTKGRLIELSASSGNVEKWIVESEVGLKTAIYFTDFGVELSALDEVFLNTTATNLSLGTGGVDYIIPAGVVYDDMLREDGHIMKLRYTPLQMRYSVIEEKMNLQKETAAGLSVVSIPLISHLPGVIAGIKGIDPRVKIAFIMTDEAALPLAFSNIVRDLKRAGLIEFSMTVGQAFGGDLEAVNIYSGLVAARELGVHVVIVGQGPGNVGTGTPLGFGGIGQVTALNAAIALHATPILSPRLSGSDERDRHLGVSHHTKTITNLVLGGFFVPLPMNHQIDESCFSKGIISYHHIEHAWDFADAHKLPLYSMGRSYKDDPIFFDASFAAGVFTAEKLLGVI